MEMCRGGSDGAATTTRNEPPRGRTRSRSDTRSPAQRRERRGRGRGRVRGRRWGGRRGDDRGDGRSRISGGGAAFGRRVAPGEGRRERPRRRGSEATSSPESFATPSHAVPFASPSGWFFPRHDMVRDVDPDETDVDDDSGDEAAGLPPRSPPERAPRWVAEGARAKDEVGGVRIREVGQDACG